MAVPKLNLDEPLTQEAVPSRVGGKTIALLSFLIGVACAVLLSRSGQAAAREPSSISMAAQPMTSSIFKQPLMPVRNSKALASLPGPPALKNRLFERIETINGRCVSTQAQAGTKEWITSWKERTGQVAKAAVKTPFSKEAVMAMAGVSGPTGFFDPLGIATNVPEGRLLFYREAELKHGRVCMLAFLGILAADKHFFIPALGGGVDADAAAYLLGTPYVMKTSVAAFWPAALAAVFAEEWRRVVNINQDVQTMQNDPSFLPGDYGWDPLGFKPKNEKELKELQTKELNNGRLAMFAVAGILAQEQVTGKSVF